MSKFREDKLKLAEICKKHPILIDKGYGNEVLTKKKEAWLAIQDEFNASNPGKPGREIIQLQGFWKRLKTKTKEELDEARKYAKQTGGGPAKPVPEKSSQTSMSILAEMFQGQFDPLMDTLDDDNMPFQEGPGPAIAIEEKIAVTSPVETLSERPVNKKMKKCSNEKEFHRRILEKAEEEHREKMEILKIKKEKAKLGLLLKQKKLETYGTGIAQ